MHAQEVLISGKVTDDRNQPAAGVSVHVRGTSQFAETDGDGMYSITVPDRSAVLEFSFRDYAIRTATIGEGSVVDIVFDDSTIEMDQLVLIGYQTRKKSDVTGSVAIAGSDLLGNRPVSNVGQALQGVIPNVNITIGDGAPNTIPSFNIRGGTSMALSSGTWTTSNGAPLILIDNVTATSTYLNQLNPNDIESITFLKDASASAIYGVRAAFGVVLVTTKSGGFNQKARINYSYDLSLDMPYYIPDILDGYTILQAQEERSLWTGGAGDSQRRDRMEKILERRADPSLPNYYMNGSSIVWIDDINPFEEVVRSLTPTQKHNLSIDGGGDNVSYYVSGGFMKQEGMYNIGEDVLKRYNGLMGINAKVTKWFNLGAKMMFNSTEYDAPYLRSGKGTLWSAMIGGEYAKNILAPITTGPDDPVPNYGTDNILAWLGNGSTTHTTYNTTIINVNPEFTILPELKIKTNFAFTRYNYELQRKVPYYDYIFEAWSPSVLSGEGGDNRVTLTRQIDQRYTFDIFADYNKTFGDKHNVNVLLGFNQEEYKTSYLSNTYVALWSVDVPNPNSSDSPKDHSYSYSTSAEARRSVFGRLSYNYDNRYYFDMNARYDGTSKFTLDDRFQFFPTFAAAWRISEEAFMEDIRWLNQLKLRGSWGKLGNEGSLTYGYQSTYSTKTIQYSFNGTEVAALGAPGLVSPSLTWEKARTVDLGIEASALNSRLNFEFSWYDRLTTDILVSGTTVYPSVLGTTPPYDNSGALRSRGWELMLGWQDRTSAGLRYSLSFALSDYKTVVEAFETNAETRSLSYLYPGMTVGNIWGYTYGGILQESDLTWDEPNNRYLFHGPYQQITSGNQVWPGYVWYKDTNGDGKVDGGQGTVDDPGDRSIIGNSTPRFRFSLNANLEWKGFDLNMLFTGVGKKNLWLSNSAYWGGDNAGNMWMYERSWRPDRTDAEYPMYGSPVQANDYYLIDASYFKLKQLVLGYTIPGRFTKKLGVERLRVNVSGYNLFAITGVPDLYDPEQISDSYPMKKTIAFGVQIGF